MFSSKTDPNLRDSFKNKLMNKNGVLDKAIGFACKKGLKPTSPNQDSWTVVQGGDEFAMYIVCDGHGPDGHVVSELAINMIPKFLLSAPDFKANLHEVITTTYQKMHKFIVKSGTASGFDADLSGCTATTVFHDKAAGKLVVAHVGDSGSCVGKKDGSTVKATVLIEDHKPELPEERARIESRGGRVEWDGYANHRVYGATTDAPGMNMSRALGDDLGHRIAGIVCDPTIMDYTLHPDDKFICVCSDGVWEFLEPNEVVSLLDSGKTPQDGCEKVTKQAWNRWIKEENGEVVDDITAILVMLPQLNTAI
jgi:serine/threonine protein phosphatase PrpC